MAAKVCRTVLLLTRSSGAVSTGLPALALSSQRHHQHIRSDQPVRRAHGLRSASRSALFTQPPTSLSTALSTQMCYGRVNSGGNGIFCGSVGIIWCLTGCWHFLGWRGAPSWQGQRLLSSSTAPEEVTVVYQNGLPVISVSLPSRRERCQFTLKPLSDCVGVFLTQLQTEDRGIDRVAIYSTDGARVASSTGIDILLLDDFNLVINDVTHLVRPPRRDLLANDEAERLNDVKFLVQQLYTTMHIEEHQLSKEKELVVRLEDLNSQLRPLEKVREELSRKAERRTTWVLWGGMAYMATQFGILARLTWWEYSWDIMEPVTYFITYATAMAMYSYYVLTRQEYIYPDARDRQYLLFFHKGVKRQRFDIYKYNELKDSIAEVELDLKRLRDPLQLQLPVQQLTATSKD
ncbi:calcium uniporter protein, mitochondrial isoform X1 [Salmo salar]|uniref:Calcium uniporter protein n=1 Tax=Salmo salar TaxID=8030 RepID=A0ABM3DHJ0_SALSA|nr:calcium uniporter protein, mitochondrial isoform X1 [Salmo salar]